VATVLLHPDVEKKLSRLPNDIENRIRDKLADAGDSPDRYLKPSRAVRSIHFTSENGAYHRLEAKSQRTQGP